MSHSQTSGGGSWCVDGLLKVMLCCAVFVLNSLHVCFIVYVSKYVFLF
jgi:hypothetical protein